MDLVITEELIARQPPEAQAIIRALLARLAKAEAELELLRRQGPDKTPQNSSLPPSTQHPHAKPVRKRQKSKKRRGGQPGHPKHERPLIPTDQCDDVQTLTRSRLPHDLRMRKRRPLCRAKSNWLVPGDAPQAESCWASCGYTHWVTPPRVKRDNIVITRFLSGSSPGGRSR